MYMCKSWAIKGWALKNWCFWIVLGKTLESPLDCKEIKPINSKGNQPWIFIGRHAEAEALILWPPGVKSGLTGRDPVAGKDWREMKKGRLRSPWLDSITDSNGHAFERTLGDGGDRGAWCTAVHGVAKNWTWLSDWKTTITIFLAPLL